MTAELKTPERWLFSRATNREVRIWMDNVTRTWRGHWRGRDHRYGHDFAAFVGERLMTDFDLRGYEADAHDTSGEES